MDIWGHVWEHLGTHPPVLGHGLVPSPPSGGHGGGTLGTEPPPVSPVSPRCHPLSCSSVTSGATALGTRRGKSHCVTSGVSAVPSATPMSPGPPWCHSPTVPDVPNMSPVPPPVSLTRCPPLSPPAAAATGAILRPPELGTEGTLGQGQSYSNCSVPNVPKVFRNIPTPTKCPQHLSRCPQCPQTVPTPQIVPRCPQSSPNTSKLSPNFPQSVPTPPPNAPELPPGVPNPPKCPQSVPNSPSCPQVCPRCPHSVPTVSPLSPALTDPPASPRCH